MRSPVVPAESPVPRARRPKEEEGKEGRWREGGREGGRERERMLYTHIYT
jgi:hypothetical protein